MLKLKEVKTQQGFQTAAQLFKAYASEIGIDLSFQNFEQELIDIQQQYSRPDGILFLAFDDQNRPVGCFGIRRFSELICELKRMYLQQSARGKGAGKQILNKSIEVAKELNYTKMRLDTLPTMEAAIKLYIRAGFNEIEPYRFNPFAEAKYFEISLK